VAHQRNASDPAFRGRHRGSWLTVLRERDGIPGEKTVKTFGGTRSRAAWNSRRSSGRAWPRLPIDAEFDLWRDVFVQQKLPWGRFLQSALLHTAAVVLIWTASLAWIRQQKILDPTAFDRSSLVTYTPEEYLPPLDTGASAAAEAAKGRSRLREAADSFGSAGSGQPLANHRCAARSQLDHDVPLPNIIATGAVLPVVPLDATLAPLKRASSRRRCRSWRPRRTWSLRRTVWFGGDEVGGDCAASGSDAHRRPKGRRAVGTHEGIGPMNMKWWRRLRSLLLRNNIRWRRVAADICRAVACNR
jgi:hypothetical protein